MYIYLFKVKSKKFKHQLKIPKEIVKKMENQKGGIFPIINSIEKEFGLEVKYIRDRFFILFGPSMSILELMSQTLVLRYVLKVCHFALSRSILQLSRCNSSLF